MTRWHRRIALALALGVALFPLAVAQSGAKKPTAKIAYFTGKVVPLAPLLDTLGAKLDADAAPYWLALRGDDGKVYPLVKDAGARMFFKDAKLLGRPMRLTGRLVPGSQLLQVVNVHSVKNGQLHEVYYWCDICTIRSSEAGICDCCGGPVEFRETPVR